MLRVNVGHDGPTSAAQVIDEANRGFGGVTAALHAASDYPRDLRGTGDRSVGRQRCLHGPDRDASVALAKDPAAPHFCTVG